MKNIIIGIDNGISGGLVAISSFSGEILGMSTMPAKEWRSRNEVNIMSVIEWINNVTNDNSHDVLFIIEEPNNSKTPSTAYSVASSFHSLRGLFEAKGWEWLRVTPQSWQTRMLGKKIPKGKTKIYAKRKALELRPDEKFLPTKRHRTPHEGLIDAFLIALYGMELMKLKIK